MIPTLYDKTGNNKIGVLNDCIECLVEEERNGIFELTMIYPSNSSILESIIYDNIIVADANDYLKSQKFRIYNTRKLMANRIEICARHISFDLVYDWVDVISIQNQSCEYALNTIFRNSQFSNHFKGYSDIVNAQNFKVSKVTCLEAIGGTSGSILDTYGTGAEVFRDNTNIHVLNRRGRDNDVVIEYRKNLTGLEVEEDTTDLVTRIMPYAIYTNDSNEEVEVRGDFVDSPLINNYAHPYVKYMDYSEKFEDGEVPTKTKLNNLAAKEYINNKADIPKNNYKIEFIPLSKCAGYEGLEDRINLCDVVTIKDSRYNIDTQAKVIKVVFDVLRGRYDSMELGEPRTTLGDVIGGTGDGPTQGPPGPPGPQGPAGADGSIGDFPETLPEVPNITAKVYGFANIELSWTFENKVYYSYELYASKTKGFTPNTFNLIFSGQASTFLYQVNPNETWYFRACALNTHGQRTEFSSEVEVSTVKISDLSNYVESAAIGDALIGELNLGRGWYGELKGNYIDARQLSVTDGSGKRTLDIDSFGNVNLDVTSLKIKNNSVATESFVSNAKNDAINSANNTLNTTIKNYYTKEETNSQINIAKDAINLNVSNIYETKSNVESKVRSAVLESRQLPDTRNTNENPHWYMVNYPRQIITEFKRAHVIGIPNSTENYGSLATVVPWNDSSGGYPVQTFRSSDYRTYERRGISNEAWGGWTQIEDINGSQDKATQAKNEAITSANATLNATINNYYTKEETNSQINVAKNEVTTTVSSLRTEVMNASYSNLLTNSDFFTIENDFPSGYHGKNSHVYLGGWLCDGAKTIHVNTTDVDLHWQGFYSPVVQTNVGQVFTASVYTATENLSGIDSNCGIELEWLDSNGNRVGTMGTVFKPSTNYLWERQIVTGTAPSGTTQVRVYCWVQHKGAVWWGKPMLQIGSTCTAWTKGGDIDTTNKRLSTAEQKITDSAIISTVSKSFYTKTETDNKVTTVENSMSSSITQLSNQIATKVDVNGVLSTIQQNPNSIQIGFNKISDALTIDSTGMLAKAQNGNKYFQLGYDGMTMYNPANGTHQWGKVAAINNKFTVASNGNSSGLSLGHHVNENYVEDILCDSNGVVTVQRQMNHAGVYNNTYGQINIRQSGQGGWEITGRSDSQSIKPGGANQGAVGSNTQYINQSWIANRQNPSSLEYKHLSHYVEDLECIKLVSEVQPARYFYKEYDEEGNDITTFTTRTSQLGLIYEDVRECEGRDLITNEEDKAINLYNMVSTLWGAVRNLNKRLNELEVENLDLKSKLTAVEDL